MKGRTVSGRLHGMVAVVWVALAACAEHPAPVQERSLTTGSFATLVEALSGPGGYFDTDNLISNESSYLHAISALEASGTNGGAYLGVGPGQNFSYIAQIEPEVAIIVDIRRDNVLEHLLFKALFETSPTRLEYLANLTGRSLPPSSLPEAGSAEELLAQVDELEPLGPDARATLAERIRTTVEATGANVSEEEFATIARFHGEFMRLGLDLRFTSHYRAPQPYYPTLRRLLLERDRGGEMRSFVSSPERYERVRAMQMENRIIPIAGDLAGTTALRQVAEYLRERELEVTAFYTSNVEYYLLQNRTFQRWVDNVRARPRARRARAFEK